MDEKIIEYDIEERCERLFKSFQSIFKRQMANTINLEALIDFELNRCMAAKSNIDPPWKTTTDGDISLYPYLLMGWEAAIEGSWKTVPSHLYKFSSEVKEHIQKKYAKKRKPKDLYTKLEKVAIESYIEGVAFAKFYFYLKQLKEEATSNITAPLANSNQRVESALREYNFFDLPKVTALSPSSQKELVRLIIDHELPYQIAMLDFVGFIASLGKSFCSNKTELYDLMVEILDKEHRSIRGNILILREESKEDPKRYTAHLHKEKVEKAYKKLK